MRTICLLGILVGSVGAAQNQPRTQQEIDAIEAAIEADLRGTDDSAAGLVAAPRDLERPIGGTVSVAQLGSKPGKRAQRSWTRGLKFSQAGDHWRAAEEFEKAVAADPQYAAAYDRLGVEYAQLGRHTDAAAELAKSLALDKTSWVAHYDLGVIRYQTGDLAGAEASVRRASELSTGNAQVHLLLGLLLWRRPETRTDALEHLRFAARTSVEAKDLLAKFEGN
jgi:Flp pilus assembly protein TadD